MSFEYTTAIRKILSLDAKIKGIQGGTSAGKTFGIIPILIDDASLTPNLEVSIVAESFPHLRRGVMRDFKKIMQQTGRWNPNHWKGTTSTYHFANGSWIEFFSADDDSKLRGARRDILYMNEANNMSFDAFTELSVRTKGEVYLDWNPTNYFWFHEHLQNDKDVDFLILTYLDNEACPENAVEYILKAKEKAQTSPFWENWYKVYGLGELGQLQGAIYTDWEVGEFNDNLIYGYGLDFGFKDPDALIKCAIDEKEMVVYLDEVLYKNNSGSSELIKMMQNVIHNRSDLIIGDSASSRMINDLYYNGGFNIRKCKKGKDSVVFGISKLQSYKIVITPRSTNLKEELINHCWHDKKANIPKNDDWHHCLDASRYIFMELVR